MAVMTVSAPLAHRVWDAPRIRMPAAEVWARLDEAAQDRVMDAIEAVFDEHREAMSEGVRHSKRKTGIAGDLDAHVRRAGRGVLLASELAVLDPGEAAIVPDVLAVMDVDPDDEPERWVVTRERRGVDVVLEVRNRLRFFLNGAMVPTESELVTRLQSLVDERQTERDEAAERAARFQASLAQNALQVLALRGVALTPAQTARIVSEEDPAALGRWAQRAFSAAQGDEVFADG
jgi:hypothetical protein